jgi:hypothetical protein
MVSETGKHLEALSIKEWSYLKDVIRAFTRGGSLVSPVLSNASKDLQELLIKPNNLILPNPEIFANACDILVLKTPAQTMKNAKHASKLYKIFGVTNEKLNAIFSASEKDLDGGCIEIFCGKPVYRGKEQKGYCPVRRSDKNFHSEKCEGCIYDNYPSFYDWVVC